MVWLASALASPGQLNANCPRWDEHPRDPDGLQQFCHERVLSSAVRVLTDMHPKLRPVAWVEATLDLTDDRLRWERELGVPIVFGAATTRIVLRENVWCAQLPLADRLLSPTFSTACEKAIREADSIEGTLGRLYRMLLQARAPYPGAAAASRALGLSERTMHRRLADQGLAFSAVLESVRRQRATALLRDTELSLDRIATIIGFSEPASFSRAYKQWTGQRPVSVRRQAQRSDRATHGRAGSDLRRLIRPSAPEL